MSSVWHDVQARSERTEPGHDNRTVQLLYPSSSAEIWSAIDLDTFLLSKTKRS